MRNKILLFAVFLTTVVVGGYFFLRQFVSDREAAMTFREPEPRRPFVQERQFPEGRTVKTYNAKGKGSGLEATRPDPLPPANEAAVQRSMRTIEEINRINEMNRRLQEQQRP